MLMLLTKGRVVTRLGDQESIAVHLAQSSVELWMTAAVMVLVSSWCVELDGSGSTLVASDPFW